MATLPAWRENVEGAGLAFRPIRPDISPDDPAARDIIRNIMDARRGPEYLFTELFGPHLREVYTDTLAAVDGADLLVSHQLPNTAPIVAQQTGVKWVSAVVAPLGFLSAYDPPTPPQAPALRPLIAIHPLAARLFNRIGRVVTNRWMQPVYRLRAELGMPRGAHPLFEGQHSPARVLALFSRLLGDRQPDYPPQAVVTGFPFYDAAPTRPADPGLLRFIDAGEPPIVFTLGSSAVWIADDFYAVSIAAARALGRRALLLVGQNAERLRARGAGQHRRVRLRAARRRDAQGIRHRAPGRGRHHRPGAAGGPADAGGPLWPGSAGQRETGGRPRCGADGWAGSVTGSIASFASCRRWGPPATCSGPAPWGIGSPPNAVWRMAVMRSRKYMNSRFAS